MTPPKIYANAVRRSDGWHCTVWFGCETIPAHVVLDRLGDLEAAAVAKYEQDNKQ